MTFIPRPWQREALAAYASANQPDFLANVTPGAGKTDWALWVARELIAAGEVERVVVVCPSILIQDGWHAKGLAWGLQLDGFSGCHGYVATYQEVVADPAFFSALSTEARTLVVLDEIHHAGDKNSWGEQIRLAFGDAARRLCLTGTAFRSDLANPIAFVNYEDGLCRPDYVYGYRRAVADGHVRSLKFPLFDGDIAWKRGDYEQSAAFADKVKSQDRSARLRTALNPEGGMVRSLLATADKKLREFPGDAGLLLAFDITRAEKLAAILADITGEQPTLVHSKQSGASRTIQEFRDGSGRWLVAVRMVSEGVDIPRLRVLAYCTHVVEQLFFSQAAGRVCRGSGEAWFFMPADPILVDRARAVEEDRFHVLREAGEGPGSSSPSGVKPLEFLWAEGAEVDVVSLGAAAPSDTGASAQVLGARLEARREAKLEYARHRRKDPAYREAELDGSRRRRQNPAKRQAEREASRRYRQDPEKREARLESKREASRRYRQDPEKREARLEAARRRYRQDPEKRKSKLDADRRRRQDQANREARREAARRRLQDPAKRQADRETRRRRLQDPAKRQAQRDAERRYRQRQRQRKKEQAS